MPLKQSGKEILSAKNFPNVEVAKKKSGFESDRIFIESNDKLSLGIMEP